METQELLSSNSNQAFYTTDGTLGVTFKGIPKHPINVVEQLYGYSIQIGCQSLSVSTAEEVTKIVIYYLSNKVECLKAYAEGNGKLEELVKQVLEEVKNK